MIGKGFTIAISGKGGVGKTSFSAFLIKCLSKHGSVMGIDADPDANLAESLGVQVDKTVGYVREKILNSSSRSPDSENRAEALERSLHEVVEEGEAFDLIVMGRPEGVGCYCAVNHIIREVIDQRAVSYDFTVIDCEPGLEHLSRRTTKDIDLMIVVSDVTKNGILTARRIKELRLELAITFGKVIVVVNKIGPEMIDPLNKMAGGEGIEISGYIPDDPLLAEASFLGRSLMGISESSIAYTEVCKFCENFILQKY